MKGLIIWGMIFSACTVGAYTASTDGIGLARPSKSPMSIREGSVKGSNGVRRTRFFVGGGIHGGK